MDYLCRKFLNLGLILAFFCGTLSTSASAAFCEHDQVLAKGHEDIKKDCHKKEQTSTKASPCHSCVKHCCGQWAFLLGQTHELWADGSWVKLIHSHPHSTYPLIFSEFIRPPIV